MRQTRVYRRTPMERHGSVNNIKNESFCVSQESTAHLAVGSFVNVPQSKSESERHDRESRFLVPPTCVVVVTKRKGFGSIGNKESQPMSAKAAELMVAGFLSLGFQMYRVNVYLKKEK